MNVILLIIFVIYFLIFIGDIIEYDYDENEEENERSCLSGILYNICI